MAFADHTQLLLAACLNTFGQAVSYRDHSSVDYELRGIFSNEYEAVDPETGFPVMSSIPNIGIRLSDWPKAPVEGEHITVNAKPYLVLRTEADGEGGAVVFLEED